MEILKNVTEMKNSQISFGYRNRDIEDDDDVYWSLDDTLDLTKELGLNYPNLQENEQDMRYEGSFDT